MSQSLRSTIDSVSSDLPHYIIPPNMAQPHLQLRELLIKRRNEVETIRGEFCEQARTVLKRLASECQTLNKMIEKLDELQSPDSESDNSGASSTLLQVKYDEYTENSIKRCEVQSTIQEMSGYMTGMARQIHTYHRKNQKDLSHFQVRGHKVTIIEAHLQVGLPPHNPIDHPALSPQQLSPTLQRQSSLPSVHRRMMRGAKSKPDGSQVKRSYEQIQSSVQQFQKQFFELNSRDATKLNKRTTNKNAPQRSSIAKNLKGEQDKSSQSE